MSADSKPIRAFPNTTPGSGHGLGPVYLGSFANRVAGTPLIRPGVQIWDWIPSRALPETPGHLLPETRNTNRGILTMIRKQGASL